uniref:Potassium channel domain-containing protein n=1 Tax=Panagrolaimus superbus TaxID=310955 RepID=A0A914YVF4_9BILA
MGSNFDSILTWPRNQAPPKLSSDEKQDLVLYNFTLVNLKQYAKNNDDPKVNELIEAMEEFLASNNEINDYGSTLAFDGLRKKPQFDSMILCETPPQTTRTRINSISRDDKLSMVLDLPPAIPTVIDEPHESAWIRWIPQIALTLTALAWLFLGPVMFQYLDPKIAQIPYYTVLTLSFQICFSIGWGNLPPTVIVSRLFTMPYAAIGVPLTFLSLSNVAKYLIDNDFTVDWMFLSNVLRHKVSVPEKKRKMPLFKSFSLLVWYQFAGVILFNTVFGEYGVINSWYFVWISAAMIGFGDVIPEPKNIYQALVMCVYFGIGNTLMQTFFISLCYQYQRLHFVILKSYLYHFHYYIKGKFIKK